MINGWDDGIDFGFPSGASVCIDLEGSEDNTIYVGEKRAPVLTPFQLPEFKPCGE